MKNAQRIKSVVEGYKQSIKNLEADGSKAGGSDVSETRLNKLADEFLQMKKPTKEIVREFIEKIEIYNDKQVDVYFNFQSLQNISNKFSIVRKKPEQKAV